MNLSESISTDMFVQSFLELDKQARGDTRLSLLFSRGMELYQSLPGAEFSSLYLLNEETFELEHTHTFPQENKESSRELFPVLLEAGVIGKALSFGTIQVYQCTEEKPLYCLVVPLVSTSAAVGLVLLPIKNGQEAFQENELGVIHSVSVAYANIFTSKRLKSKLERSQDLLDQKVASRTIELSQSKTNLFEKFESFRSSISMSIPHEVRTPLNQILGFSEYLLDATGDVSSDENREIFADIHNAAEQLHHLFENYIYYNRLNMVASNIEELEKLKEDVVYSTKPFLENLIQFEYAAPSRTTDIHLDLMDAAVAVSGDYFKKIVQELFSNAVKYSNPGTPIQITTWVDGDRFYLSFQDQGRGMTSKQVKSIEAFIQFDRASYEQQGTGLGMAISTRIIDIYNGTIQVESELGEGTIVSVGLPLAAER